MDIFKYLLCNEGYKEDSERGSQPGSEAIPDPGIRSVTAVVVTDTCPAFTPGRQGMNAARVFFTR